MKIGLISDIHNDQKSDNDFLSNSVEKNFQNGAVGLIMSGDIADSHAQRKISFEAFKNKTPAKYHENLVFKAPCLATLIPLCGNLCCR